MANKGSEYHVGFQKLLDGGGTKKNYGGNQSKKSGTRSCDTPKSEGYGKYQGTVSGGTKHKNFGD